MVSFRRKDDTKDDPEKSGFTFEMGGDPFPKRDHLKRPILNRTKSRSVECLKSIDTRQHLFKKSVLRHRDFSDSESSFGSGNLNWRSRSCYRSRRDSPAHGTPDSSNGSLACRPYGAQARLPSYYGAGKTNAKSHLKDDFRCGSTPPTGGRNSLTGLVRQDAIDVHFRSSLNLFPSGVTNVQSEENLLLDKQRQNEKTWMHRSRLREESSIIKNIKKRELVEMKKKQYEVVIRDVRDDKKKPTKPLILIPSPSEAPTKGLRAVKEAAARSQVISKSIISGLLGTKNVLLAPTAATLIDPGHSRNNLNDFDEKETIILDKWVPPPILKPRDRNLVRKFLNSLLSHSKDGNDAPSVTRFTESNFIQDCLKWHNTYRENHSADPLEIDEELCAAAQYWANILAHQDKLYHENPPNIGENLFAWPIPVMAESSKIKNCPDITGQNVSVYWYKTIRQYDFNKHPDVLHAFAGQFSQMLWASTKFFGCGKARSKSGKIIVVARYFPKGNIPGEFHLNVFPEREDVQQETISSETQ